MKTITVAAAKGGAGKSTITSALAARATQESMRVAMMDLNSDQASLTRWWRMRGEPMNPYLVADIENIPDDVEILRGKGYEWLFIDTPPLEIDLIEQSIVVADVVVIPVRTSIFDVISIDEVVELCKAHRKPFAFVLSAFDGRVTFKVLTQQTIAALVSEGPIFGNRISYQPQYVSALMVGKTGAETSKSLKPEVDGLWAEVKRLANGGKSDV